MPEMELDEQAQVFLDGSGNGAVVIGPTYTYQTWVPSQITVTTSTNVKEPVFKYYRGRTAGNTGILGGTYTGSNDQSDISGLVLHPGEVILAQWTGGDAGALATVALLGKKIIP